MASRQEQAVLTLLSQRAMYGLEMVREHVDIERSTVYALLGRMEDAGFVESNMEQRKPDEFSARRMYKITQAGRNKLAELNND